MRVISLIVALLAIAAEIYLISEDGPPRSFKELGFIFIAIGFGSYFLFAKKEERKEPIQPPEPMRAKGPHGSP